MDYPSIGEEKKTPCSSLARTITGQFFPQHQRRLHNSQRLSPRAAAAASMLWLVNRGSSREKEEGDEPCSSSQQQSIVQRSSQQPRLILMSYTRGACKHRMTKSISDRSADNLHGLHIIPPHTGWPAHIYALGWLLLLLRSCTGPGFLPTAWWCALRQQGRGNLFFFGFIFIGVSCFFVSRTTGGRPGEIVRGWKSEGLPRGDLLFSLWRRAALGGVEFRDGQSRTWRAADIKSWSDLSQNLQIHNELESGLFWT